MRKAYDRLIDGTGLVAGVCVAAMAVAITVDIVLRYFDWGTIRWVVEVSEYDLFVITFLGAPWVLREGGHVRVDLVASALPLSLRRIMELAAELIGLVVAAALGVFGLLACIDAYVTDTRIYKTLTFHEWWLLALLPLSGALLSIEFVRRIRRILVGAYLDPDRRPVAGM